MSVFFAILATGIGTYAMRAIFIVALSKQTFPAMVLRTLEYVAPAVMGALIVSLMTGPDGSVQALAPELVGLATAAVVAARTRNHVYTLVAAMLVFWATGAMLS